MRLPALLVNLSLTSSMMIRLPSIRAISRTRGRTLPPRRLLSTPPAAARPHPLASPLPKSPRSNSSVSTQKWSSLTAVLLATLTGGITYALGFQSALSSPNNKSAEGGEGALSYREPTAEGFKQAMIELEAFLPKDCVRGDRESLEEHGHSVWSHLDPSGIPGAVLFPRNTEDVVRIVKIASAYAIPLIPFCGGTSLEGHLSTPSFISNPGDKVANDKRAKGEKVKMEDIQPGLAWSLDFSENMNAIIKVNVDDLDCIVQPGVSYDALNDTLKEDGIPLFFPVDPAPGAMIGGMVGTGASGTNAVRYGTMRENVINLTVVLPSGEVIKTRSRAKKSSAGPDLSKLFIGSEGTLGIIVEATLKLSPLLPSSVAVSSFPTIQAAADAVKDIIQQGVGVACVELLDGPMIKAINKQMTGGDGKGGGRTWEEKPTLFFKFSGTDGQIKSDVERTRNITKKNQGSKFTFASNEREAEEIWYSRKVALWSALDYVPGARCWVTDVCVPISNLPQLVAETCADMDEQNIYGPIVGHAGDGNFHALLMFSTDEELERVKGIVHRMVERAQRLDGTCTGEHGVGRGKKDYLEAELGVGTVDLMRKIKKVIDPQNIMNPGKLVPDGHGSCMH